MINERTRQIWPRIWTAEAPVCSAQFRAIRGFLARETMTGTMTAFAIAVGSTSLVYDLLMTRPKHRRAKRCSHDSPASDGGQ
jgi:hypothetical protein